MCVRRWLAQLLVLARERDGLLPVLIPRDVDAPRAAAYGAVLLEGLLLGPTGVDVDVRGLAAIGATELRLRVAIEVELPYHRARESSVTLERGRAHATSVNAAKEYPMVLSMISAEEEGFEPTDSLHHRRLSKARPISAVRRPR